MAVQPSAPDIADIGRAAAQLSDWQTMAFFLMALLIMAVIERGWSGYSARVERQALAETLRKEREDMAAERGRMWGVSEKFGDAASKLGGEVNNVVTELQVQRALNARLEGFVADLEKHVSTLERHVGRLQERLSGRKKMDE